MICQEIYLKLVRKILVLIIVCCALSGSSLKAQTRRITEWRQDGYRVMIAYHNNQPRWAEMSKQALPFELPSIVRGADRKNYILKKDGHWLLEKDVHTKINAFGKFAPDDSPFQIKHGQVVNTEHKMFYLSFSIEKALDNVRLVAIRDNKATSQAYVPNTKIVTRFPRNQAKTSITTNVRKDELIFFAVELAMCENAFSLHLPGGEKLFQIVINRTLPKNFFTLKDTVSEQGIFIANHEYPSGKQIVVSRRVVENEILYSLTNQNEFDVEVTLSFGSEYNVLYPYALNSKQFGHPTSMEFGFRPTRIDKAILKGSQKAGDIRVYLDKCEYARNPFSLSVSSIRPIESP